jgi:hypothetical protein
MSCEGRGPHARRWLEEGSESVAGWNESTVLATVAHGERTPERVLGLVRRDHDLVGFRYHLDEPRGRALMVLSVARPRNLIQLVSELQDLTGVHRCRPFDVLARQGCTRWPFEVERYDLRGRSDVDSRRRHEALVAVRVAGRRQLGVGEAEDEGAALAACFANLPSVVSHAEDARVTLFGGQLGAAGAAPAYAWSLLSSKGRTFEALRAGSSAVDAGVNALAASYADLLVAGLSSVAAGPGVTDAAVQRQHLAGAGAAVSL